MKTTGIHLGKLFLVCCVSLLLYCCQQDDTSIDLQQEVPITARQSTITTVNAADIPEVINHLRSHIDEGLTIRIATPTPDAQGTTRNQEPDLVIGEVQLEEIQRATNGFGRSNYSFALTTLEQSEEPNTYTYYNLVYVESLKGDYYYITAYKMDKEWVKSFNNGLDLGSYTGAINYYTASGYYLAGITMTQGVVQDVEQRSTCPDDETNPNGDPNGDPSDSGGSTSGDGGTTGTTGTTGTGDGDGSGGVDPRPEDCSFDYITCEDHEPGGICSGEITGIEIDCGNFVDQRRPLKEQLRSSCPDNESCAGENDCEFGFDEFCGCLPESEEEIENDEIIINITPSQILINSINFYLDSDLTQDQEDFIISNEDIAQELLAYLEDNFSGIDKTKYEEALLTILTDIYENPSWTPDSGVYRNRQALAYTHTFNPPDTDGTMYLLENGAVLFETNTERAINEDDLFSIATSDGSLDDAYYYVFDYNSEKWYEYLLPTENFDCLSCDIETFFQAVLENGGVIIGRYILPIEDILILMTGEDFDGVSQSRAVAGAFLLAEIIPGSDLIKLLRLTKFGDEAVDLTQAVIRYIDDIASMQKAVIKDVLDGIIDLEALGNTIRKGNFGEMVTDLDFILNGYEPLHVRRVDIDQPLNTGIDGIFKNAETGEFLIVESKFNTSSLGNTVDGRQMSDDWILGANSGNNRIFQEVGEDLGEEIIDSGYTRVLSRVLPDGTIIYKELDAAGFVIGNWIP